MKKLFSFILILLAPGVYAAQTAVAEFVAFDVETTGLSPAKERIIEIGYARYKDGAIMESGSCLINPGIRINNAHIHGITNEMVADQPGFTEAYAEFSRFVGDSVLIAHNASFDVRFMRAEIERNNLAPVDNPVINSLSLFRRWYPDAPSHKLSRLSADLDLPPATQHRAQDDAATLIHVLQHGIKARPDLTLQQIQTEANGFYYFDGSRQ
jgi:DNA polymerase-3 subunit alpha (Gram-positive type)